MLWTLSYCYFAGKVACPHCNMFINKRVLQRHIRNQHGGVQNAECSICGATLKNEEGLKDHMRRKHNAYQTSSY